MQHQIALQHRTRIFGGAGTVLTQLRNGSTDIGKIWHDLVIASYQRQSRSLNRKLRRLTLSRTLSIKMVKHSRIARLPGRVTAVSIALRL
jgi:hypothetical protein